MILNSSQHILHYKYYLPLHMKIKEIQLKNKILNKQTNKYWHYEINV